MPKPEPHFAVIHPSPLPGFEVVDLVSARSFPRHAHDQFGLGVVISGSQRSWSGRGQVEASAGDVITTNPGEMHDGSPGDGRRRAWRMLYLSPSATTGAEGETLEITRPVIRDRRLRQEVLTLIARAKDRPGLDVLALEESLTAVLALVQARYASAPQRIQDSSSRIGRALARLRDDPASEVRLGDLARMEGLSRFQLLRSFVRELGITPHAYQTQLRVRLARRLLACGQPPAEVACAAGFSDQSHLNRVFLQQVGVTPGRYRAAVA